MGAHQISRTRAGDAMRATAPHSNIRKRKHHTRGVWSQAPESGKGQLMQKRRCCCGLVFRLPSTMGIAERIA
eukprot:2484888-Pleurochrysis_carterae.AAC.3